MFAVLEFGDFFWIALIVAGLAGGSAAYSGLKPSHATRIERIEAKIDLILKHLGLENEDLTPPQQRQPGSIVLPDD